MVIRCVYIYVRVTVWLDVDIDNIDVDWRSEEVTSSDETSDSSDDEAQLAESPLDDELNDELDGDELDDDEYLEEVKYNLHTHYRYVNNNNDVCLSISYFLSVIFLFLGIIATNFPHLSHIKYKSS